MFKITILKNIKNVCHRRVWIIQTIAISLIALCLVMGVSCAAWKHPNKAAPYGNVATPLNVGPITQTKSGGLNINGNVGIGTINPKTKLDVEGGIIKAGGGLVIEVRANNPTHPQTGQIWLIK